ncbi:MAG: glycerophosphodiester phosphodiesterase family protein [Fimbriimonadaceae bacterium]
MRWLQLRPLALLLASFATLAACQQVEAPAAAASTYSPAAEPAENYVEFETPEALQAYLSADSEFAPFVSAHRGGPEPGYPENAIETFENALRYAPVLLEMDVRETADGTLVLMHDETLERTTTGVGLLSETTLAELQELYLVDNDGQATEFKAPTLDEVLEWSKGRAIVQLDVKRGVSPVGVLAAIARHQAEDRAVVIVYNLEDLLAYHTSNPNLMVSSSVSDLSDLQEIREAGVNLEKITAFTGVGDFNEALVRDLNEAGVLPAMGTFGDMDEAAERQGSQVYDFLLEGGLGILATDNVPKAAEAVHRYSEEEESEAA